MNQAGWHTSDKLDLPANISIVLLAPKSPELDPVESTWQFMRDNWLSNRILKSVEEIVDQPWRHHLHRIAQPGKRVLINAGWY